jgi:D-galactarolactone cycloisomerase
MNWEKPGPLTIQKIETEALRIPLDQVYRGSKYSMDSRCTIITRLYTHQGVVGEVYTGDTDREQAEIIKIIHNELAPALVGMDVFNTEGCWEAMKPATYDILRDRGVVLQAIAAMDTAIWDTLGRALEMPLVKLWGGYQDRLPIIAIGGYYGQSFDELAREVQDYRSYDLIGMKFKIGGMTPEEDIERLKIAREAAGPDFHFMVDANQGMNCTTPSDLSGWRRRRASRCAGLRSRCAGTTTAAGCAMCGWRRGFRLLPGRARTPSTALAI